MDPLTDAERAFVERNLGLAYHQAQRTPLGEYDDRVQDGMLGLIEATRRYDPALGTFATFASLVIRGRILDGFRRRWPRTRQTYQFVSLDGADRGYRDSLADPSSGPEAQAVAVCEAERRARALYLAMSKLRPILVDAVLASPEWAGWPKAGGERLAARQHVTGGAISHRKRRALRDLRVLLRDLT